MDDTKLLIEYGVLGVVAFIATWWAWTIYKDYKALQKEFRDDIKSLESEIRSELKQMAEQYAAKSEKWLTLVLERHDAAMEVLRAMEDRLDVED